ncbi:MAG: hypothetical protein V7721_00725 [Porticoccaceae bacterium]
MGFLYFFVGVVLSQKLNILGEFYFGEVVCAAFLLFNLKSFRLWGGGKGLIVLLVFWFSAQLISDIYNQVPIEKSIKGVLVPFIVGVVLTAHHTYFSSRSRHLPLYLMGLLVGFFISRMFIGNERHLDNPWKWGMGLSFLLCFFVWIEFYCKRGGKYLLVIFSALFTLVSLSYSSRSLPMFFVGATTISCFSKQIQNSRVYNFFSDSLVGFMLFICFFILVLFTLDFMMASLFSFGSFMQWLPEEDALKYSVQAGGKWGFLLGGRSELLVSLEAFFDRPMLGHGSWPESMYYSYQYLDLRDMAGSSESTFEVAEHNLSSFLIPTHSYLMGALVWGGIFAGLFWLRILLMLFSSFLKVRVISSPLLVLLAIYLIWSILFSPFGADARWLSSVLLWFFIYLVAMYENR